MKKKKKKEKIEQKKKINACQGKKNTFMIFYIKNFGAPLFMNLHDDRIIWTVSRARIHKVLHLENCYSSKNFLGSRPSENMDLTCHSEKKNQRTVQGRGSVD